MGPGTRLLAISLGTLALAILAVGLWQDASAQTDPPALGDGDWTVTDRTVIRDWDVIMLRGDLRVTGGGRLTLANTTLLFVNAVSAEHGIRVDGGSTLEIVEGTKVGSSRLTITWTFSVGPGCSLVVRDAAIEECGKYEYGIRPKWREVSFYVGTSDAVIENTTFTGGLVGPYFPPGVVTPPVRNCTFENHHGVMSHGTAVEDCLFRNEVFYGVVFLGGTEGRATRCRFENSMGTCAQVGYEFFEPYDLVVAEARIEECVFLQSNRGMRVLPGSRATVVDCDVDSMDFEGLVLRSLAHVELVNGEFTNLLEAIFCEPDSHLDWNVTGTARVEGGSVRIAGNITVEGRLDLLEFRNLTMLGTTANPLSITLGDQAVLRMVNGSLDIPDPLPVPETWHPVALRAPRASVLLEGVDRMALVYPVEVMDLECSNSTVPVGDWHLDTGTFVNCDLVRDPGATSGSLVLRHPGDDNSSFASCRLEGFADTRGLFEIRNNVLESLDFLHSLDELVANGTVVWNVTGGGEARLRTSWTFQSRVHWQNQLAIANVVVKTTDNLGHTHVASTDGSGSTAPYVMVTEMASSTGTSRRYLPLVFSSNVSGLEGRATLDEVTAPTLVNIQVMDLKGPRLAIDQGSDLATNVSTLVITGSVMDEHSGMAFLEVAVLPSKYLRVPIEHGTGAFRVTLELRTGFQTVSLRAYDNVGNRRTRNVEVLYSTVPPFIFIQQPLEGAWVNSSMLMVVGQTNPNSSVEAQGRVTEAVDGAFRTLVYLEEGANLVSINVTNPAGNSNSTQVMVHLDTRPPSLSILSPSGSPFHTTDERAVILGLAEHDARVFINSVPIDVRGDGTFEIRPSLDQGANAYTITARDRAGNVAVVEVVMVLDSEAPSLVVLVDGEDAHRYVGEGVRYTSSRTCTIDITTEEGALLEVGEVSKELDATGYTVTYQLREGANTITVHVEDAAGNGVDLGPINVEADWSPPKLHVQEAPEVTHQVLFSLRGSTEPNVTVYVNGARVSVDSQGGFVKNFLLNQGENRIVVEARDRYGQSSTFPVTITVIPPEPEPWSPSPSALPYMLAITLAVLAVWAMVLHLWWRRRRGRREGGDRGGWEEL